MRLLVIDGNSIANRAFYGIKMLTTKDGQFTNAIYGFLNILIRLRAECEPDAIAVAFDLKAPTFRHEMYSEYKAGRKGMPPELRSQMPIIKEILGYLGCTVVEKEGFEADDILGTLSAQCKGEDMCYIATGDRDSLQLVSDNTHVLLAATKMGKAVTTEYDKEKLREEYGVEPKGMIEIKALMGDSSDNFPGVAGIGQKTAGDLIINYGNIDYIYEHLDELDIKKGVREKLEAGKDSAYLSRTLGTICLEAPVDTDIESYRLKEVDNFNAINMLVRLEMFGIIEKLGLTRENISAPTQEKTKAFTVSEERDLPKLMGEINKEGDAYFLTEYDGKNISRIYFAFDSEVKYVSADCFDFAEFFKMFCESDCHKYTADAKQLYKYALSRDVNIRNIKADTALIGYILNPSANSYEVKRLCEEYGVAVPCVEGEAQDETACTCAAMKELCDKLLDKIEENSQTELLTDIEIPLSEVLASMENIGFLVNKDGIEAFGKDMAEKIDELTEKIYNEVGFEFNLNSPKQLGVALFEKLGLPCKKKTKSGYSTNAEVLEELADEYPVVSDILQYRTLAKLRSTYCEGRLKVIDSDVRIRSTLNQT